MPRKPTDVIQINLRIREGFRRRLEREAQRANHSLNAEMILRLEKSFEQGDRLREVFGDLENPALFRLALGEAALAETALAKQETLKHAPDEQKAGQAVARVLAAIARHVLAGARWVEVRTGTEGAESAYKQFVPTATLAGNIFVKGSEK